MPVPATCLASCPCGPATTDHGSPPASEPSPGVLSTCQTLTTDLSAKGPDGAGPAPSPRVVLWPGRNALFLWLPGQQGPQDVGRVEPQAELSRGLGGGVEHRGLFQGRDARPGRPSASGKDGGRFLLCSRNGISRHTSVNRPGSRARKPRLESGAGGAGDELDGRQAGWARPAASLGSG